MDIRGVSVSYSVFAAWETVRMPDDFLITAGEIDVEPGSPLEIATTIMELVLVGNLRRAANAAQRLILTIDSINHGDS